VYLTRLTPTGRGGVATLLLTGTNARDIFLLRFVTASNSCREFYSSSRPYFGKLRIDESEQYEEVVARIIDSDNVEIHCHGGNAIFAAIEKSFANDGVQTKDYTEIAETNSQRELALRLLPFAATERVAQILIDQYHGAMDRKLAEISELETTIDQMIATETAKSNVNVESQQLVQLRSQLCRRLQRIDENRLAGQHLIEPFRVVLTGETNVGKSSLFNAILGYNRAIISPLSGTTRDVVIAQTSIAGFPVAIYDTAGIRNADTNGIENEGIRRSIEQIAEADLVIRVIDLSNNSPVNNNVAKNILTCYNKSDLSTNLPNGICISAKTGNGVTDLIDKIAKTLLPNPPLPFEALTISTP
jgi:tRNA modification GTPase